MWDRLESFKTMPALTSLDLAVAFVVVVWVYFLLDTIGKPPLPPGPKGWPVIGNAFDMPQEREWATFVSWRKTYGDIVYLRIFGSSMLILNSFRVAHELLDKRSGIYSGRPALPMAVDLAHYDWGITLIQNSPWHRYQRTMFEQHFRPQVVLDKFGAKLRTSSVYLLKYMLNQPKDFMDNVKLSIAANIIDICYGTRPETFGDPIIKTAEDVGQNFIKAIMPGKWLVDTIPILKYIPDWFPGAGFKKIAKEYYKITRMHLDIPFDKMKAELAEGKAKPCVGTLLIEEDSGDNPMYERAAREVLGVAYGAGMDTTSSILHSLILHLALYPSVQRRAQEEIDSVCPSDDRQPDFGDRSKCVYLECLIREIMRLHPSLPMSVPHRVDEEDVFEGMWLPKGSVVVSNLWGMMRDERIYPDPDSFIPERHMKNGVIDEDVPDPRMMMFGFGRRQCPGRGMADNMIFISISRILRVFDILPPVDEHGFERKPEVRYSSGMFHGPVPFSCRIVPRSKAMVELVQNEFDQIV